MLVRNADRKPGAAAAAAVSLAVGAMPAVPPASGATRLFSA